MKKNIIDFFKFLFFIQIIMNNSINVSTKIFFNEILYNFKELKFIDFLNNDLTKIRIDDENPVIIIKKNVSNYENKSKNRFFLRKQWRRCVIIWNIIRWNWKKK